MAKKKKTPLREAVEQDARLLDEMEQRARRTHAQVAACAPSTGGGATDGWLSELALHTSHRLFQRWKSIRNLSVPTNAPSIQERLLVLLVDRLPETVAARTSVETLERYVRRVSKLVKVSGQGSAGLARLLIKPIRR